MYRIYIKVILYCIFPLLTLLSIWKLESDENVIDGGVRVPACMYTNTLVCMLTVN